MVIILEVTGIIFLILVLLVICFCDSTLLRDLIHSSKKLDKNHVNEESYQRYAKFYGSIVPNEENFDERLLKIYDFIVNKKVYDINLIAEKTYCNLTECVLKIRYLKNKRLIGDFYIDTVNKLLVPCNEEEQKLLDKYKPYIYNSHLQIKDMVSFIPNPDMLSVSQLKEVIFQELNYLDEKGLLNGVRIDDVDRTISYYSVEKRKTSSDLVTVHCPNCGALNDVNVDGKVYCSYCKNIVTGKDYIE